MLLQAVIILFTIFVLNSSFVNGARYEFIATNDEVFEPCPDIPDNNGVHDLYDISDFVIEYKDGEIHGYGNATTVWDVKPTDRIQLRGEGYKFERGAWQPTPYTVLITDFCKVFFREDSIWYNIWTHAVHEADRVCLNHKGRTYHHDYFSSDTTMEMVAVVEGRYKVVITFQAFDENNIPNPSIICMEVPGEIIKL